MHSSLSWFRSLCVEFSALMGLKLSVFGHGWFHEGFSFQGLGFWFLKPKSLIPCIIFDFCWPLLLLNALLTCIDFKGLLPHGFQFSKYKYIITYIKHVHYDFQCSIASKLCCEITHTRLQFSTCLIQIFRVVTKTFCNLYSFLLVPVLVSYL